MFPATLTYLSFVKTLRLERSYMAVHIVTLPVYGKRIKPYAKRKEEPSNTAVNTPCSAFRKVQHRIALNFTGRITGCRALSSGCHQFMAMARTLRYLKMENQLKQGFKHLL